jgi:sugar lactone lactonase YvrE
LVAYNNVAQKEKNAGQYFSSMFFVDEAQPGLPDGFFSDQKFPIWARFGGPWNGKCCLTFWSFGVFYDQWVYFMGIG